MSEMDLLKKRDPDFLRKLFIDVNPMLLRMCFANAIYDESAKEVVHRCWEKFFSNLDQFGGRSQIRTFICGILINKIREFRREQKKYEFEEDSEKIFAQTFTIDGWWKTPPSDPQKIVEMKQSAEFVRECLEGLSEQQRSAFVLREVEEESTDEICRTLEVDMNNLRVLIFRAKDKLKKCLDGKLEVKQA